MEFEIDHEALRKTFLAEVDDDLQALEEALLTIERNPLHPEALHVAFRQVHTLKGNAGIFNLSGLEELAHAFEEVLEGLREGTVPVDDELVTLLLHSADTLREVVAADGELQERHRVLIEDLTAFALTPRPATTAEAGAVAEPAAVSLGREGRRTSLRVDLVKLDRLMDLVGEITVARGREGQLVELLGDAAGNELHEAHQETGRLLLDLQELAMETRMVRLGPTLKRYHRTVRDVTRALGKQAKLTIEGEDVEADATLVEHLRGPLTHMIRNALDHGLETPDERRERGKDPCGSLTLRARHESGSILIELVDDGVGFDRRKILERAREAGLVAPDEEPRDWEIDQLVFEPGLSTAGVASELSGRGVGMDVVRRSIEAIRGSIQIVSRPGEGTTVAIRLPLTLAIIDGLEVTLGRETYVIPMEAVVESIDPPPEVAAYDAGGPANGVLRHRGHTLPYVDLRRFFRLDPAPVPAPGHRRQRENVVVVEHGDSRAGLVVDSVRGQHQTVIKPLSKLFQGIPGLSGTTILGDGRVAFILDVTAVLRDEAERSGRQLAARVEAARAQTP